MWPWAYHIIIGLLQLLGQSSQYKPWLILAFVFYVIVIIVWVLNSSVYGANPDILWRSDSERLLQMDTSIDWGTCSISSPAFLPLYPKSEKRNRVRGCRVGWMEVKCVAASHWSVVLEHTSNTHIQGQIQIHWRKYKTNDKVLVGWPSSMGGRLIA